MLFSSTIAILGRPNVGKSTLLNRLVGRKISIVSPKPQTTRHRILGIHTAENKQIVYVDTPGFHLDVRHQLNRYMNQMAKSALYDVDAIMWVIEANHFTEEDEKLGLMLSGTEVPVLIVINKVDKAKNTAEFCAEISKKHPFSLVKVSAKTGEGVVELQKKLSPFVHEVSQFEYDPDKWTDRSPSFLAAEIIREKLFMALGEEVPYQLTVEIERFEKEQGKDKEFLSIEAVIVVERENHKAIVIGAKGERIKQVGIKARLALQELFQTHVMLRLWVKAKPGWMDDPQRIAYWDKR